MFTLLLNLLNLNNYWCIHQWKYWHIKMRCDHKKNIDGNILHNSLRRCEKCHKQQMQKMTPGNFKWVDNYNPLPNHTNMIEMWFNVIGKKNKSEVRNDKIDKILKNGGY